VTAEPRGTAAVQAAHDLLFEALMGPEALPLRDLQARLMTEALEVLCWVIGDKNQDVFESRIRQLEERRSRTGFGPDRPGTLEAQS